MTYEEMVLFYDLMAPKSADEWYADEALLPSLSEFVSLLPASPSVLDLGCGQGHESMRLARLGARVTGVDISARSIEIAAERNPGIVFHHMDFFDIAGDIGVFDGIFASAAMIHLDKCGIGRLLGVLRTVLRDRGIIYVIAQEGRGAKDRVHEIDGVSVHRVMYAYCEPELAQFFQKNCFSFVRRGFLEPSLSRENWMSCIFQKLPDHAEERSAPG